jgi:cell division inhibitor SepF
MIQDQTNVPQDKSPNSSPRNTQKVEVDLFPALLERSGMPMIPVREGAGARGGTQISMFTPMNYDEALDIVACLRGRSATTISLENMRKHDANRLVDFIAGASAALDGDFHKLNDQVYLFCPSNIRIVADGKEKDKVKIENNPLDYLFPGFPDKNGLGGFKPGH